MLINWCGEMDGMTDHTDNIYLSLFFTILLLFNILIDYMNGFQSKFDNLSYWFDLNNNQPKQVYHHS
jgi:hypothetical protein